MRVLGRGVVLLACLGALLVVPSTARADTPSAFEHVVTYDVAMNIESSGLLDVRETIVYDFGTLQHHGIFRDILERENYQPKNGYDRVYRRLADQRAHRHDHDVATSRSSSGGLRRLTSRRARLAVSRSA